MANSLPRTPKSAISTPRRVSYRTREPIAPAVAATLRCDGYINVHTAEARKAVSNAGNSHSRSATPAVSMLALRWSIPPVRWTLSPLRPSAPE